MRTGIVGLPSVGKSTLFKILTKAHVAVGRNPRDANVGVVKVPDDRLDRLAALYNPRKLIHASVEYADLGAIGPESFNDAAYLTSLRGVDCFAHVVRAFEDPSIPHVGPIDPEKDIRRVDFDLIVSDLGQVEKRLDHLEKDLRKMKGPDLEIEKSLLKRAKSHLEKELPLRELEMSPDEKRRMRGFTFLSEKPVLHVVNIGESDVSDLELVVKKYRLEEIAAKPGIGVTAVCGKVEAELAEMRDEEAAEFLSSYGLKESGLVRLIRKTYELLGLISFFTVGEDECRAWTVAKGSRALDAAGTIHTDLAKHFIRAETIRWDELLEAGSEAAARTKGTMRLEGKEYQVRDGDVVHIRHSG